MKSIPNWWVFAFLLYVAPPAQAQDIMVSAAASLTDALQEVGRVYSDKSRIILRFNFGASSNLARQIEQGAPADLFFSADAEKMDVLERKGMIDSKSRRNLLSNKLVFAARVDSKLTVHSPKDLLHPAIKRIALAQPDTVPAGIYFKKFFLAEGLWKDVAEKIVPVQDVRATLATIESGNVDLGLLYKTDAAISPKVRVLLEIPREKGPRIVYPAAVVMESRNRKAAAEFLAFVSSPLAKGIFEKHGFVTLP
ncbi:MAG: molybdate ABC transporter substrate-binding protein [Deltaproteobacteria bacterium]|nr:molybdate ABC transporter substrate-binding protein [Deltaproteobacteria bacterium]